MCHCSRVVPTAVLVDLVECSRAGAHPQTDGHILLVDPGRWAFLGQDPETSFDGIDHLSVEIGIDRGNDSLFSWKPKRREQIAARHDDDSGNAGVLHILHDGGPKGDHPTRAHLSDRRFENVVGRYGSLYNTHPVPMGWVVMPAL